MENVMKAFSEFRRNTSSYAGFCEDYEMIRTALERADKAQGLVEALKNIQYHSHSILQPPSVTICAIAMKALAAWEKE